MVRPEPLGPGSVFHPLGQRPGALWLIYRADAQRTAVALVDGVTGESVNDPVFQETVGSEPGLADHEPFPATALSR